MGLSTFWSQVTAPKVKEITPQQAAYKSEQRRARMPAQKHNPESNVLHNVIHSSSTQRAEDNRRNAHDTRPRLVKQKSEENLKKRRSWFGGRPAPERDVPAMPTLPSKHHERNRHMSGELDGEVVRPGTALTTSSPANDDGQEKRKSLFGRKRSQSSASHAKAKRRQSWFSRRAVDEEAPPVPPVQDFVQRATQAEKEERVTNRLSLNKTLRRSYTKSQSSVRRKRKSWFQSSNPDDSDDEWQSPVPPVPALIQDHHGHATPDSSVATRRSPDQTDFLDSAIFDDSPVRPFLTEDPVKTVTRGNSIKQPRPVSGVSLPRRSSYVPKNAAKGFLNSTTPNRRSVNRHSLLDDGEGGMMCLSNEQQREWEKLKNLMETLSKRQDDGVFGMVRELEEEEDGRRDREMYKNEDALAALELGVAR